MATGSKLYIVRVGNRKFMKLMDNGIIPGTGGVNRALSRGYKVAELVAVNHE